MDDRQIAEFLIRVSVGLTMFIFGAHQIVSPQRWLHYIPGPLKFIMPIQPTTFLRIHGSGNILLGVLLITDPFPPVSICLALTWWLWVMPFAFYYDWTVGLRDFAIAMALLAVVYLN